jgi:hypothetical protein
LTAVEVNQHRTRERVGLERVDPEHADQLALDCLTEIFLTVKDRVKEPQPSRELVLDFPMRNDRSMTEIANLAVLIAHRRNRSDGHARRFHV